MYRGRWLSTPTGAAPEPTGVRERKQEGERDEVGQRLKPAESTIS